MFFFWGGVRSNRSFIFLFEWTTCISDFSSTLVLLGSYDSLLVFIIDLF